MTQTKTCAGCGNKTNQVHWAGDLEGPDGTRTLWYCDTCHANAMSVQQAHLRYLATPEGQEKLSAERERIREHNRIMDIADPVERVRQYRAWKERA